MTAGHIGTSKTQFTSGGFTFNVVGEPGRVAISIDQAFSLEDQRSISFGQVGSIYTSIMAYARQNDLRLRGSEADALAFLMTTSGVGNLWFDYEV